MTVQVTSDDGVTTATMHAVKVGGSWHWVLQPADLAAVRRRPLPLSRYGDPDAGSMARPRAAA